MPPCTVSGGQATDAQSAKIWHPAELNADAALHMILEPARDRARCASRGYITHPHVALATSGEIAAAEAAIMRRSLEASGHRIHPASARPCAAGMLSCTLLHHFMPQRSRSLPLLNEP